VFDDDIRALKPRDFRLRLRAMLKLFLGSYKIGKIGLLSLGDVVGESERMAKTK